MRAAPLRDRYTSPQSGGSILQQQQQQQQLQQQQQNNVLPQYIVEKREKARAFSEAAALGPQRNLSTAVATLHGSEACLRLCVDIIEGAVLALGVPSAHHLISTLNEARNGIQTVEQASREATRSHKEEMRLQCELFESLANSYASLREKNETAEKEIRRLVEERNRKKAAADHAVQYVYSVVAERAVWQEKHSHNVLDLPLDSADFSENAVAAIDALKAIKDVTTSSAAAGPGRPAPGSAAAAAGQDAASPGLPAVRAVRFPNHDSVPLSRHSAVASSLPSSSSKKPSLDAAPLGPHMYSGPSTRVASGVGMSEWGSMGVRDDLALQRIRDVESNRHVMITPASRLHYIPPSEEVELLREVLAMGTGSSALMIDIQNERAALERRKRQLLEECAALQASMQDVRRNINALRAYLHGLVSEGMPFLYMREDLMQLVNERIEKEARSLAQSWVADMTVDAHAVASGRFATVTFEREEDRRSTIAGDEEDSRALGNSLRSSNRATPTEEEPRCSVNIRVPSLVKGPLTREAGVEQRPGGAKFCPSPLVSPTPEDGSTTMLNVCAPSASGNPPPFT